MVRGEGEEGSCEGCDEEFVAVSEGWRAEDRKESEGGILEDGWVGAKSKGGVRGRDGS